MENIGVVKSMGHRRYIEYLNLIMLRKTNDSWLGSGSLFSLGGVVETATFHQSQDSVNLFSTEDYDLITGTAPNPDVDYGTTTEGIPQGAVDHGHIGFSEDVFGGTGGPRVF